MKEFLFPQGLFLLAVLGPPLLLVVFLIWRQEQEVVRAFLQKAQKKVFIAEAVTVLLGAVFLALILARPFAFNTEAVRVRFAGDTAVLMVFDVSRSMLAQNEPYGETRLDRAKAMGRDVIERAEAKIGIAGFTDTLMAHILPTANADSALAVLKETVRIDSIPFGYGAAGRLDAIVREYAGFFPDNSKNKVIIVFTDGDMPGLKKEGAAPLRESGVAVFFVGVGDPEERIYGYDAEGKPVGMHPVAVNFKEDVLREAADILGGSYIREGDTAKLIAEIKKIAGKESIVEEIVMTRKVVELTPLAALASFAALTFFLYLRRPI